jgi:hypothetical protein
MRLRRSPRPIVALFRWLTHRRPILVKSARGAKLECRLESGGNASRLASMINKLAEIDARNPQLPCRVKHGIRMKLECLLESAT